jgi:hypothetical protein
MGAVAPNKKSQRLPYEVSPDNGDLTTLCKIAEYNFRTLN